MQGRKESGLLISLIMTGHTIDSPTFHGVVARMGKSLVRAWDLSGDQ